jgi:ribosomal-protein-serine acetyltransferase
MFRLTVDEEIELRLLEKKHAEELFILVEKNRSYLREWLPWLDITTSPADTTQFIQSSLDQFAANNGFQTAIFYRGRLVGMIGFHKIDWPNRATSIGYWLDADAQGRGIISRSCRFLIDYVFREFGLNRVEIRCAVKNQRSCAIAERLGFSREGLMRQAEWLYDHFVDHIVYSLLEEEWSASPNLDH